MSAAIAIVPDQAPYLDEEIEDQTAQKEYRLLICDQKQWLKAKLPTFECKVAFVIEVWCSEQEYNLSPIVARTNRQWRTQDVLGRRYGVHVELFADENGVIPQCLSEQYLARGCNVTGRAWSLHYLDSLPVLMQDNLMAQVVAQTNKTLEWAIIVHISHAPVFSVIPCTYEHFRRMALLSRAPELRARIERWKDLTVIAFVRKNVIVWMQSEEYLCILLPSIMDNNTVGFVVGDSIGGESTTFQWKVPLVVPTAVKDLHDKPTRSSKGRRREKAKAHSQRQETVNLMEEASLEKMALPHYRKVGDSELARVKEYIKHWAARHPSRKEQA